MEDECPYCDEQQRGSIVDRLLSILAVFWRGSAAERGLRRSKIKLSGLLMLRESSALCVISAQLVKSTIQKLYTFFYY